MAEGARWLERWNDSAAEYDARTAWVEKRFLLSSRQWLIPRAYGAVLEVAIGTGANLPHYPKGVRLSGIDWSPAMLARARERAARLGVVADLQVGDALQLPFADNRFDTVVCTFSLCSIPDVSASLREMVRVLRPGGRLLLADHVVSTSAPMRWIQHTAEFFTARSAGEHWTRRPLDQLGELGVRIEVTQRRIWGMIETIDAHRLS